MGLSRRLACFGVLVAAVMALAPRARAEGHLSARALHCEYLVDPIGVGERTPRLAWVDDADRRDERQTAYRILVASSAEKLGRDEGDLWDSGRVASDESVLVSYAGAALASREVCYWKVRVWDRDGEMGAWSAAGTWEMGLLAAGGWSARWVDAGPGPARVEVARAVYGPPDGTREKDVTDVVRREWLRGARLSVNNQAFGGDPAPNVRKRLAVTYRSYGAEWRTDVREGGILASAFGRTPYLRTSFRVDESKKVARARLYATALGVYDVWLNGKRVGDGLLAPGWTDYRKRVRYQVCDVTDGVRRGENALGAMVGPGWFCGRAGLFHARAFYGEAPALLAQLEITYADGSVQRLVTDGTWQRHDGPLLMADIMDGDVCDGRAEIAGWCEASFDASGWETVKVRDETRTLEAQSDQPIRVLRELPARAVAEPTPGHFVFDLGQNMVGVVRLKPRAKAGTVITIRHAEILNPDGTIYTANLRGAAATDVYVCSGRDGETWQPPFTFHGFRYVELTGLEERPDLDAVAGVVLGTDVPTVGEFSCSDPRLNRLQSNIVWGMHGNMLSIPTDCPQRDERMGWAADAQVFLPTAVYNADMGAFMSKWAVDLEDAQRDDGAFSDVAPAMKGLSYGTPAWGDAGVIVPWEIYQAYGDKRILERHIESMERWVEWCRVNSTGLIRDTARGNDYGDWLSIRADTPKDLIGTAYFAHAADIVARALDVLGRADDAAKYRKLLDEICAAFVARYMDPDERLKGDTQCAYTLALRFALLPEDKRSGAVERLVADIHGRGDRLSTGFVGVANLLPVLADAGRDDVAYRVLTQDAFPSWLFSVKHGATTVWERWDGWTPERGPHPDDSMNSFNHFALGSCGEWLFAGVGGIEADPASPGFKHFRIHPRVRGPLTTAAARYRSVRGEIVSEWKVEDGRVSVRVVVPANTSAQLILPCASEAEVTESGATLARAPGVHDPRVDGHVLTAKLGSGEYYFVATLPAVAGGPER